MKPARKVAVSLPGDLLATADRAALASGLSRSALFREALTAYLEQEASSAVERYVAAYREQPESPEEIDAAMSSAIQLLVAEPYEPYG
jgi:metal-responsive CopG/Arc/MetJ family transcriptional regulator